MPEKPVYHEVSGLASNPPMLIPLFERRYSKTFDVPYRSHYRLVFDIIVLPSPGAVFEVLLQILPIGAKCTVSLFRVSLFASSSLVLELRLQSSDLDHKIDLLVLLVADLKTESVEQSRLGGAGRDMLSWHGYVLRGKAESGFWCQWNSLIRGKTKDRYSKLWNTQSYMWTRELVFEVEVEYDKYDGHV